MFPTCSELAGRAIHECIVVVDMHGLGLHHFQGHMRGFLQVLAAVGGHYPEVLHRLLLVNVPRMMRALWAVASRMLPDRTKSKVQMLGHDWRAQMLAFASPDNLPVPFGGTSQHPLSENWGPWLGRMAKAGRRPYWDPGHVHDASVPPCPLDPVPAGTALGPDPPASISLGTWSSKEHHVEPAGARPLLTQGRSLLLRVEVLEHQLGLLRCKISAAS